MKTRSNSPNSFRGIVSLALSFCILHQDAGLSVLLKLRNSVIDYLSRLKLDYTIKLYPSSKNEHLSAFIKSLKMKRSHEARDARKVWTSSDCKDDKNIEFYCHGRLPVFNEWISENAKEVSGNERSIDFSFVRCSFSEKSGRAVVQSSSKMYIGTCRRPCGNRKHSRNT